MNGSTKFCRYCGMEIPVDSEFCEKCGKMLTLKKETVAPLTSQKKELVTATPRVSRLFLAILIITTILGGVFVLTYVPNPPLIKVRPWMSLEGTILDAYGYDAGNYFHPNYRLTEIHDS